jgi:hypothetical protein
MMTFHLFCCQIRQTTVRNSTRLDKKQKNLPLRSAFSATSAPSPPRQDSRLWNQGGRTQKLRLHGAPKRIQTLSVLADAMLRLLCVEGIIARCRVIVRRVARTAAERA